MSDITVTAASDIEVDREALDASINEFAEKNGDYYSEAFHKIHESTSMLPQTFNVAAALLGPIWAAMRGGIRRSFASAARRSTPSTYSWAM